MHPRAVAVAFVALALLLPGCSEIFFEQPPVRYGEHEGFQRDDAGTEEGKWPDLNGETLTILDNGAFFACTTATEQFHLLTGVNATCENGEDAGIALDKVAKDQASGSYDVVYGLDNLLLAKAEKADLLIPYTPTLADRVPAEYLFFNHTGEWPATPVDHGWVALNVDDAFRNATGQRVFSSNPVDTLAEARDYADHLVVQDPNTASPGLAFLAITVSKYGEDAYKGDPHYDWHDYWRDLLNGTQATKRARHADPPCVLVTTKWGIAYEQHFSAGYKSPAFNGTGLGDKPIVVSYTESPAYEDYNWRAYNNGTAPPRLGRVVTEPGSTWHQIQTMAIVKGTRHLEAAQAWIEYTLTDHFQSLAAGYDAVYPVVTTVDADSVYGTLDPEPGSFAPAYIPYDVVGANVDRWIKEWRALYEDTNANCRR